MASITLMRRKSRVKGKSGSLYVQVIQGRITHSFSFPWKVYNKEWDEETHSVIVPPDTSAKRAKLLDKIKEQVKEEMEILEEILEELEQREDFTSQDLIDEYKQRNQKGLLVFIADRCIQKLEAKGSHTTARHYRGVVKRFLRFVGTEELKIEDINVELLLRFSHYLTSRGLKKNTLSFYFRILRALWNYALHQGLIPMQPSPFHVVFTGMEKTRKRAVQEPVIQCLGALSTELTEGLCLARDLFLFSFYTQGMAFIDLAYLTKKNIQGGYLVYIRHKTKQELRIKLLPCMKELIEQYTADDRPFLFPVLKGKKELHLEYESALRLQNKRLKKLAVLIAEPDLKLTTYVARHSWASIANEKGVSIEIISRALGHTSLITTYIYVSHLDNYAVDKANELVVMGKSLDKKLFACV